LQPETIGPIFPTGYLSWRNFIFSQRVTRSRPQQTGKLIGDNIKRTNRTAIKKFFFPSFLETGGFPFLQTGRQKNNLLIYLTMGTFQALNEAYGEHRGSISQARNLFLAVQELPVKKGMRN